ncbi:MAG: CocE/NonD family hydrolase [Ktedonobacterales bacterium]
MSLTSRLTTWLLRLPTAETYDLVVTRDLKIAMPDGAVLLADHYTPRSGPRRPTILVRSPYGRRGFFGATLARPFAERGYQVLIQSCRGTDGSADQFVYARTEHGDGLATIEWIKQQDWFTGELAMIGPSYFGFVQWSVASDSGPELKALVPQITSSDFHHFRYQGGAMKLETALGWSTMMTELAATGPRLSSLLKERSRMRRLELAYRHLPLKEADKVVIGRSSTLFQDFLGYGPEDSHWQPIDFSSRVGEVQAPTALIAGWYDLFLDWQLKDYQRLRAAGRQPTLLIGPWCHVQFSSLGPMTRETLAWLNAHLKGDRSGLRAAPVRLLVMGTKEWRDFADWPPPATIELWHLHPGGGLRPAAPPKSDPDQYRYDPADPTPAVGGNSLGNIKRMGARDNRELEARSDVLVYTSPVLARELEVIGPVIAELYVKSSLEYTDFFARLCVVEKSGKSINLCDGILRLCPGQPASESDGIRKIRIELWPTAYHFQKGERLRLQVSSGAHPRFARNLGSGEPVATATTLKVADQMVYHDPEHPSAILLPIYTP